MSRDVGARLASQRVASRKWYAGNREKQIAANKKRRQELLERFRTFKLTLSCQVCGESHPACLDFHHNDPEEKEMWLHQIGSRCWGRARTLKEAAKCRLLCSNCHRKFHWEIKKEVDNQGEGR